MKYGKWLEAQWLSVPLRLPEADVWAGQVSIGPAVYAAVIKLEQLASWGDRQRIVVELTHEWHKPTSAKPVDKVYHVIEQRDGTYRCDCPAGVFLSNGGGCKHERTIPVLLRQLIEQFVEKRHG